MKVNQKSEESILNSPFRVSDSKNGAHTIILENYEQFSQLLGGSYFRDYPEYVFRGHRDPSWPLLPSLYRELEAEMDGRNVSPLKTLFLQQEADIKTANLLKHFLYGLRGTLWQEPAHDMIIEWFEAFQGKAPSMRALREDSKNISTLWPAVMDVWAIGQHHDLWTPLLDWTESLLAAFYFAFEKSDHRAEGEENRVVFALNRHFIEERCKIRIGRDTLDFVKPYARKNQRLIAQRGLFTYSNVFQSVNDWVAETFSGEEDPVLIRILIRNVNSKDAIRWLNRAGLSDRTIFPDLAGISQFSNRTIKDKELDYN